MIEYRSEDFPELMDYTAFMCQLFEARHELYATVWKSALVDLQNQLKAEREEYLDLRRKMNKLESRITQLEKLTGGVDDGK